MTESHDWDEERYERILGMLVEAARVKFHEARQAGKRGWHSAEGWSYLAEPVQRAKQELDELAKATGTRDRLREAGDVLNFLVFDYSVMEPMHGSQSDASTAGESQ